MESLVAQSNILAVIGQLFPSKATTAIDGEDSPKDSFNEESFEVEDAGKLNRHQLEKQIKKLQGVLTTKK